MGRSTASCFKIITCGSDSVGEDDVQASESTGGPSDKRGWSFRKRSATHRVLSNTVISETPSSLNEESPETVAANLQTQSNTAFPEKTSAVTWKDEMPQLFSSMNLKVSDAGVDTEDEKMIDVNPDESVIVVIQAAIRGFLAHREMLKLKSVIKLQAAIRGHLVRMHAVGTLRCVQAIIKMQALVRAHRARLLSEGSCTEGKLDGNHVKHKGSSNNLENVNSEIRTNVVYTSIEKLLNNKFAHQLLESTPRANRIHFKCDPSKSDSAWTWLERWMSVLSVEVEQHQKLESRMEQPVQDTVDSSVCQVVAGFGSEGCESTDLKGNIKEIIAHSKSEDILIIDDADIFDSQACQPSPSSKNDNPQLSQPETSGVSNSEESSLELLPHQTKHSNSEESLLELLPNQTKQSDSISQVELKSETESEQSACPRPMKRFAPEQEETHGKKFMLGTRKTTNPAFIAVQSKFEELSSTANSARSTSSQNKDVRVESNSDSISRNKVGGSECGTELSITSTLDSPDRYEMGAMDVERKPELSEGETSNPNSSKSMDIEANGEITIQGSDLSHSISVQPEKLDKGVNGKPVNLVADVAKNASDLHKLDDAVNGILVNSVAVIDTSQETLKPETNASNVQIKLETSNHAYKSSPEASPKSHMTVLESQATPSSQVSVKAERSRSDKGASKKKRKSLSSGKRPPSNPNHDSGARISLEKLPTDNSTGKRRDSFGSGRTDYNDQEPRDSNSSNSLPNYMQATESARAKALANSSPRSSPDVQDKDIYIKKRHSLPGANGRHGSPHIQRSTSRTEQGTKGNGHPQERKWQR